jgi:hypothetical protein
MLSASCFLYGRTRTLDYRWLAKPEQDLKASFFADVLERQRSTLANGHADYLVCASEDLCLISAFFVEASLLDQRGRQIAFSAGLSCDPQFCRDFAYFLPNTLRTFRQWLEMLRPRLANIVALDEDIGLNRFDLQASSTSAEADDFGRYDSKLVSRKYNIQHTDGLPSLIQSSESRFLPQSQASLPISDWLDEQATLLRRKPNTPEVICSFDCSGLGSLIEPTLSGQVSIGQGYAPLASSQMKNVHTVRAHEGKSKADEIRDFAKLSGSHHSSELTKQPNVTAPPPALNRVKSAQKKDTPATRKSHDMRSVFDRLRGKSPPHSGSMDEDVK